MDLDLAAAARQDLDRNFKANDVDKLLSHTLSMSPHPDWSLPHSVNWLEDPFDDNNWRHQFQMLRWLEPLRRAAAHGNDSAYSMWIHYARDWWENNPSSSPASPYAWRDMVDGIRAVQFCLAAPLIAERSPEDLTWLTECIRDHAEWLSDENNLGHSNHAFHQHQALFVCARVLGDEGMTSIAIDRIDQLLQSQYDAQGVNAEGAITYHYLNLVWWEKLMQRLDVEGVARPLASRNLKLAAEELAHATRPDGTFVSIGDTDGGNPYRVTSPLTDYVTSAGAKGEPPPEVLKIYDSGYLFARSGWGETERNFDEETFFSVSFGSSRRVHGHPDGGSVTYTGSGINWIVDPGKYQYGTSVPRTHFLSRRAHNLVTIEGMKPRREASVKLVKREVSSQSYDFTFDDESFKGVSLRRRIVYSLSGEYIVVIDTVRSDKEVTAELRWQLDAGVEASLDQNIVRLSKNDRHAAIAFVGTSSQIDITCGQDDPFDGWVATGWKQKEPANAIQCRKHGNAFRFISVIATDKGEAPKVKAVRGGPEKSICLEIEARQLTERIAIGQNGVMFLGDASSLNASGPDSSPRGNGSASKSLNPPSLEARRDIFKSVIEARDAGAMTDHAGRQAIAGELLVKFEQSGIDEYVDLGTLSCIGDLKGQVRGKDDPKVIDPQRTALINWDDSESWRPTFYDLPVVTHLNGLNSSALAKGPAIHTVPTGPLMTAFALDPAPGSTLTVLFHGAIDRAKARVPMFQRWRFQRSLDSGPTMAFSDPTLDLSRSLRLGWYLGTEESDLHPQIAQLIAEGAKALKVNRIVLVGNSGGGFAALHVGAHLPDATVVAISPQTDLSKYVPRLAADAIRCAFGAENTKDPTVDTKRTSVMERLESLNAYPQVWLVSNSGDKFHIDNHQEPLGLGYANADFSQKFTTINLDLGPGHRSPSNEQYHNILARAYAGK